MSGYVGDFVLDWVC